MRPQSPSRDVAMILTGAVAGFIASRFLPPLLAAVAGSTRARAGGDPFRRLLDDHRQILSLLDEMLICPATAKFQRGRLFLALKRKLAKHALAEEDVVYPRVHNDSANGDERKHLYEEHADMKIFLYEIEDALKSGEDWAASVATLRTLVRRHVEEEEKTIFPELRRELAQRLPEVSGQISREEALIL